MKKIKIGILLLKIFIFILFTTIGAGLLFLAYYGLFVTEVDFLAWPIQVTNVLRFLLTYICYRISMFSFDMALLVFPYYRELDKLKRANKLAINFATTKLKKDFIDANNYKHTRWPYMRVLFWKTPLSK